VEYLYSVQEGTTEYCQGIFYILAEQMLKQTDERFNWTVYLHRAVSYSVVIVTHKNNSKIQQ
jgi:hypothetical protein